jgi:hypothetical protein
MTNEEKKELTEFIFEYLKENLRLEQCRQYGVKSGVELFLTIPNDSGKDISLGDVILEQYRYD